MKRDVLQALAIQAAREVTESLNSGGGEPLGVVVILVELPARPGGLAQLATNLPVDTVADVVAGVVGLGPRSAAGAST